MLVAGLLVAISSAPLQPGVLCMGLECLEPSPTTPDWSKAPIMVINLDSRVDRMANFARAMAHTNTLGMGSVCRLPGVNASAVWPGVHRIVDINAHLGTDALGRQSAWAEPPYTRGSVGCALSHLLAMKRIVELGLPFGVVMEDDVTNFYTGERGNFSDALRYLGSPTAKKGEFAGWEPQLTTRAPPLTEPPASTRSTNEQNQTDRIRHR